MLSQIAGFKSASIEKALSCIRCQPQRAPRAVCDLFARRNLAKAENSKRERTNRLGFCSLSDFRIRTNRQTDTWIQTQSHTHKQLHADLHTHRDTQTNLLYRFVSGFQLWSRRLVCWLSLSLCLPLPLSLSQLSSRRQVRG